jgi:integrase
VALDLSARPDELLKLRIKDITFERQYANVLVNGKTGSRSLVLIDSIPFVKEWCRLAKFLGFIGIEAEDGSGLEDKASLTSIGLPRTY